MDKSRILEHPVAKAAYNKSKLSWKIFWQRSDSKWHRYQPSPEVASVEEFLDVVQKRPQLLLRLATTDAQSACHAC
jgi:DUF3024 family protein